jgi:L-malate glycosyltransferase
MLVKVKSKQMTLKILVISDYRQYNAARPEAAWFIALAGQGHHIDIMTYPESEAWIDRFRKNGVGVVGWHPRSKGALGEIRRIRRQLIEGQYDVLHLFNSQAMLNGIPAALGLPVKVVLYRGYAGNIHWYDPSAYLKYLHPRVDGVVCITEEIRVLVNRQNWYRSAMAAHIPKGHDPAWYSGVQPADLRTLGIPEGAFTVACMANNRAFKDVPTLLRAAVRFTAADQVYLLLIGKHMDTPENLAIIRGTSAEDRVRFAGFLTDPLPYLKACQVIALTSTGGEAITKAVLESMSLGLAPVITDIAGNRHLIRHGENGFLVPVRDPEAVARHVLTLAEDPAFCTRMGEAARTFMAKEMHIERTVEQLLAYYHLLTGKTATDSLHTR